MKLSVISHCCKTHILAIEKAHELGLDGVQIYATIGDFSPENLTPERKQEYKDILKKYGK